MPRNLQHLRIPFAIFPWILIIKSTACGPSSSAHNCASGTLLVLRFYVYACTRAASRAFCSNGSCLRSTGFSCRVCHSSSLRHTIYYRRRRLRRVCRACNCPCSSSSCLRKTGLYCRLCRVRVRSRPCSSRPCLRSTAYVRTQILQSPPLITTLQPSRILQSVGQPSSVTVTAQQLPSLPGLLHSHPLLTRATPTKMPNPSFTKPFDCPRP